MGDHIQVQFPEGDNYLGMSTATQVNSLFSLATPLWVGAMSTIQRPVTPCGWKEKAGMVPVGGRLNCVIPLFTHGPYLSTLEIKGL